MAAPSSSFKIGAWQINKIVWRKYPQLWEQLSRNESGAGLLSFIISNHGRQACGPAFDGDVDGLFG